MNPTETVTRLLNGLYHRSDRPTWYARQLEQLSIISDEREGGIETIVLLLDLVFGPGVPQDVTSEACYTLSEFAPRDLKRAQHLRAEVAHLVKARP